MFLRAGVLDRTRETSKAEYRRDCSSESHAFSFPRGPNFSCLSLCISGEKLGMKMRNIKLGPNSFFFFFLAMDAVHAPHMKKSG